MIVRIAAVTLALALLGTFAAQAEAPDDLYAEYARVLKATVDDDGMVYYRGLQRNPQHLVKYLSRIGAINRRDFDRWSDNAKIAFWLNAYNGITLKAIIDHYPIKKSGWFSRFPSNSIRQIDGVWKDLKWTVLGERLTLHAIEHEILRKEFDEPRIHVALVCAAMSCPELRREPYVGDRLDKQLTDQSERFVRNPKQFRIDRGDKTIHMSAIFDWFGGDFVNKHGRGPAPRDFDADVRAPLNFALIHLPEGRRPRITDDYDIDFLDYDWSLNERTRPVPAPKREE